MCCINHKIEGAYKCCCCIPLLAGVVLIFIGEAVNLIWAIMALDVTTMIISGALVLMFIAALTNREREDVRKHLYHAYFASLVITLAYLFIYVATQDMKVAVAKFCFNAFSWEVDQCYDTIYGALWLYVMLLALIITLIRGSIVRLLYYWYKAHRGEYRS